MSLLIDNRIENFKQSLNFQTLKKYGVRLNVSDVKELGNNNYKVYFNYNKIFNVIDENSKKVYIRNIYFENIYGADVREGEDLKLPLQEINNAINDEFIELRNNLFNKVISNKKIMIQILKSIHTTSAFLNKFYVLLNELVYDDVIKKDKLTRMIESDKKYEKYIQLLVDSDMAEFNSKGELKASNKFKKLLEENKKAHNLAVEEAISKVLSNNYDYIIHELGIRHLKPYVDIIACMLYLSDNMKINRVSIDINNLYKIYENLFNKISDIKFNEKLNSLVMSGIFSRTDNAVMLQC